MTGRMTSVQTRRIPVIATIRMVVEETEHEQQTGGEPDQARGQRRRWDQTIIRRVPIGIGAREEQGAEPKVPRIRPEWPSPARLKQASWAQPGVGAPPPWR